MSELSQEVRRGHDAGPATGDPDARPDETTVGEGASLDVSLGWRDLVEIVKRSVKTASAKQLPSIAAALAYYAFLAIPSVLLVALGLFGLVGDSSAVNSLVGRLGSVLPAQAESLLRDSLTTLTAHKSTGLTIFLVGLFLALWSLSGAMQNVMWGLNVAYGVEETRGFLRKRRTALEMLVFAALGVILVFGLLVLGPQFVRWIGDSAGNRTLVEIVWWVAQWPLLIGGLIASAAGIHYLGPNIENPRWRLIAPGSIVGIVAWLALSGLFSFYTSKFGSYNKTWGSLSAVVVMLTWLWLSGLALLVGGEINAQVDRCRLDVAESGDAAVDGKGV